MTKRRVKDKYRFAGNLQDVMKISRKHTQVTLNVEKRKEKQKLHMQEHREKVKSMLVFMTLGQDHAHSINGKVVHKDVIAVFKNMTEVQVREMMSKDYDNKYCTTYTSDTWGTHNMQYYPDGYVCVDFEPEGDELCPDCRKHFVDVDLSRSCQCHNSLNPPCGYCEDSTVNVCPGCGFDFSN